jgi:glycosyltransferase involved in cell wall biosynthesis
MRVPVSQDSSAVLEDMKKDRKISVLHLRDSPWVDGPGRTILETGAGLNPAKYGYYVGAFCKKGEPANTFIKAATERKLNVFQIYESHGFDGTVLFQVRRLIERHNIDIVHTHEVRSDIIGLIAGKMSGIPVMTTLHGWIENGLKGRLFTRLDKSILRLFDHVITVSEKMKEQALVHSVRQEKVTVLHNALVLNNYRRNAADKSFRREIGVADETLLVGNIGRLSPEKGQADFIMASRIVLERHQDARFLLVGTGDEKPRLEALVQNCGLNGKVVFLGYRPEMVPIYNSLDLVVQNSFTEGMPNVVLEALAMEVPVIATDVGGTSEAIIHDNTGILVKPGKPEEIAGLILKYINDKSEFMRMAERGKISVSMKFCMNERTRKLSELYDFVYSAAKMRRWKFAGN